MRLTRDDELKVNAAIRDAEKKTSGEIICIHTERVSDYPEVALGYAAGVALLLPLALVAAGVRPWAVEEMLAGWRLGGADPAPEAGALAYALMQSVIFIAMLALMAIKPLRLWLTPSRSAARRCTGRRCSSSSPRGCTRPRRAPAS
jgi:putative membrane protein